LQSGLEFSFAAHFNNNNHMIISATLLAVISDYYIV